MVTTADIRSSGTKDNGGDLSLRGYQRAKMERGRCALARRSLFSMQVIPLSNTKPYQDNLKGSVRVSIKRGTLFQGADTE